MASTYRASQCLPVSPAASAVAAAWVECSIAAAQSCSDQARSATSRSSMVSPATS